MAEAGMRIGARGRGVPGLVLALALTLALTACAATYNNHGFIPPAEELDAIEPGLDTRESLALTVGRPSAAGVIREDAWFYAAYRMRHYAYRAPEVIEREVVAISFDEDGVVENVERFGLEDGQAVRLSRRVTDSGIGDVTLITQLLRNFGRINTENILGGGN